MTTSLLNSLLRALLRWGAALVFCLPLRHRTHFWARACGMLLPLLLLAQLLDPLAQSTTLWQQQLLLLVLYISFFALLGGMIYLCTDINKKGALYCAVWSLLIAQCAYESWCFLELQFTRYGHPLNMASPWAVLVQLLSGAVFFAAVYILLARQLPYKGEYNIGPRQLFSAFFIGILFMVQAAVLDNARAEHTPLSLTVTILIGQFYFITLLYFQSELFKKSAMEKEMSELNLLYERQRQQYQVARQNVQIINKRCHELKVQIANLRKLSPEAVPPERIDEAERAARLYDANRNTGNEVLDVVLTLPLVLPPTVVGWLLLVLLGPNRPIGAWVQAHFGLRLVMTWWSAVFATVVVAFPLMYRTARGAATLGRSNIWIFWRVRMPVCRQGILAGTVLAFARALGEYGATSMIAGYTPGRTATISTTVYQLWRTDNDTEALRWVLVNIAISAVFLLAVNLLEARQKRAGKGGRR